MQEIDISKIAVRKEKKKTAKSINQNLDELLHREIHLGKRRLTDKKKQQLYSDLHMLISSGIDLKNAFEIVSDNYTNTNDKAIIDGILQGIIEGDTLI